MPSSSSPSSSSSLSRLAAAAARYAAAFLPKVGGGGAPRRRGGASLSQSPSRGKGRVSVGVGVGVGAYSPPPQDPIPLLARVDGDSSDEDGRSGGGGEGAAAGDASGPGAAAPPSSVAIDVDAGGRRRPNDGGDVVRRDGEDPVVDRRGPPPPPPPGRRARERAAAAVVRAAPSFGAAATGGGPVTIPPPSRPRPLLLSLLYTFGPVGVAVVLFWRGVWDLQDLYLFPGEKVRSAVVSAAAGVAVGLACHLVSGPLDRRRRRLEGGGVGGIGIGGGGGGGSGGAERVGCAPRWWLDGHPRIESALLLSYDLVVAVAAVSYWRGVWLLWDELVLPSRPALQSSLGLALGAAVLLASGTFREGATSAPVMFPSYGDDEGNEGGAVGWGYGLAVFDHARPWFEGTTGAPPPRGEKAAGDRSSPSARVEVEMSSLREGDGECAPNRAAGDDAPKSEGGG